jgi:metal-responsive CopG/Arc/MetJ family transcriptional regulator
MSGLSRETRLQIMLSEEELAAIDNWRFEHRMPSRAAAIRNLLNMALKVHKDKDQSKPLRSQDYGLLDESRENED